MSDANNSLLKAQQVVVTVAPDGSTNLDFVGFIGKSCLDEDNRIRDGLAELGILITETNFVAKPELTLDLEVESEPETTSQSSSAQMGLGQ
jgi:hypothetical protein